MPSVVENPEKPIITKPAEPIKKAILVVEKKVRNLEKRKTKLEAYKASMEEGVHLNLDQKIAVNHYEEVVTTIEFAKELQKQFTAIAAKATKNLKRQAKREQMERHTHELERIQQILAIQDVLNSMGSENVRIDFQTGDHGATTLTEENLTHLDELYKLITPSREIEEGGLSYEQQLASAALHLVDLLEGDTKEILGTTYKNLKELIEKIHGCGYFNRSAPATSAPLPNKDQVQAEEEEEEDDDDDDDDDDKNDDDFDEDASEKVEIKDEIKQPEVTDTIIQMEQGISAEPEDLIDLSNPPDGSIFSTFPQNQPMVDTIPSVDFNFLQESQIEEPHIDPAIVAAHPMPTLAPLPYPGGHHIVDQRGAQFPVDPNREPRVVSPSTTLPATAVQVPPFVPQSIVAQPIGALTQNDYGQPIPSQTFTNQTFVALQNYTQNVFGQVDPGLQQIVAHNVVSAGNHHNDLQNHDTKPELQIKEQIVVESQQSIQNPIASQIQNVTDPHADNQAPGSYPHPGSQSGFQSRGGYNMRGGIGRGFNPRRGGNPGRGGLLNNGVGNGGARGGSGGNRGYINGHSGYPQQQQHQQQQQQQQQHQQQHQQQQQQQQHNMRENGSVGGNYYPNMYNRESGYNGYIKRGNGTRGGNKGTTGGGTRGTGVGVLRSQNGSSGRGGRYNKME